MGGVRGAERGDMGVKCQVMVHDVQLMVEMMEKDTRMR